MGLVQDWTRLLLRARLGSNAKAVGLVLAVYANADGGSIRPGQPRLVVETELSERAVRDALKALRDAGLLEEVRRGNVHAKASEYRLCVTGASSVPSKAEHDAAVEVAQQAARRGSRARTKQPIPAPGAGMDRQEMPVSGDLYRHAATGAYRQEVPVRPETKGQLSGGTPAPGAAHQYADLSGRTTTAIASAAPLPLKTSHAVDLQGADRGSDTQCLTAVTQRGQEQAPRTEPSGPRCGFQPGGWHGDICASCDYPKANAIHRTWRAA